MGSNLQSSELPESIRKAFLEAFSKFKQRVLWKWETDSLPGQPKNVRLGKWLPQSDILAHPNVRLFITHGGLLSMQEAIYRGVPLLGVPIFGDQGLNMGRAVSAGYGLKIDFVNVTTESLTWAIREIIETPTYRENAQRLSRIYRDQPLTPLDQAVFWTEYVIRHKGAPHMRSASLDLAWYQYFLIAVLTLAAVSSVIGVFLILRSIVRKICSGRRQDTDDLLRQKKRS
ncbi:UDP-glucuronosyltransferase 2C1 [Zootermopsis nevadensis]|uniref:UDP-glucuronosyltransferase n=2 Tax=Zootermopsis nevadensis TaxID=136037 RepID=A0A067RIC3_ZOONE|nr:UDP-glucuronosyltransferase 2C1 [Zootermopsis nevadensis]